MRKCDLRVAEVAGDFWERQLLFRDYLRAHPETWTPYARAKRAFVSAGVEPAKA